MQSAPGSRTITLIFFSLFLWALTVVAASLSGALGAASPFIPPSIAALSMVIPFLCYRLSPPLRLTVTTFGLRRLTALHILRIAAVPLFFWYGARGLLPRPFVDAAGWGDLASGIFALIVVAFWRRPSGYWTAHLFGMLDFIIAFATAIRMTLANPHSMHAITGLPMALIPFFAVGFLGSTHLIAFDLLLRTLPVNRRQPLHLRSAEL